MNAQSTDSLVFEECKRLFDKEDDRFDFLNNKSICIIGACGLIGRYFLSVLETIKQVRNISFNVLLMDLRQESLESCSSFYKEFDKDLYIQECNVSNSFNPNIKVDYVLHAGSPANPVLYATKPVETMLANFEGTMNVLTYIKDNGGKMIFTSSGEVYGSQTPIDEQGYIESQSGTVDSMLSRSCYTEGKRSSESLCASFYSEYGVDVVVARLCFIYGPTYSPTDTRVIFQLINNVLDGNNPVLKSEGKTTRSYLYSYDCVIALLLLFAKGSSGEAYNVAPIDKGCSIRLLAETCADEALKLGLLTNNEVKFDLPDNIEKKGFSVFDYAVQNGSKLSNLGFEAKVSLQEGVHNILCIKRK